VAVIGCDFLPALKRRKKEKSINGFAITTRRTNDWQCISCIEKRHLRARKASHYGDPVKSIETTGHIRYISSKFGKFPVNIGVVVAREAYKEAWLQGPSAVIALPAACLVNTGPYRGTTLQSLSLRLAAKTYTSRGTLDSLSRPCWLSLKSPYCSVGVAKASINLANRIKF
jgi:hypothetical protein